MPSAVKPPQTLYDKVFEDHIVEEKEDGTILLYIGMSIALLCCIYADQITDRHLVHEVTSPVGTIKFLHNMQALTHNSKHSKVSVTLAEEYEDQTAPLLQLTTYVPDQRLPLMMSDTR
jgi:homoaconitase/3-isopropylmalate dehydratase large subunit